MGLEQLERLARSNEGRNCASSKAPFVIDSLSARLNDDHAPLLIASVSPWRFHNPERRKIVFPFFFESIHSKVVERVFHTHLDRLKYLTLEVPVKAQCVPHKVKAVAPAAPIESITRVTL